MFQKFISRPFGALSVTFERSRPNVIFALSPYSLRKMFVSLSLPGCKNGDNFRVYRGFASSDYLTLGSSFRPSIASNIWYVALFFLEPSIFSWSLLCFSAISLFWRKSPVAAAPFVTKVNSALFCSATWSVKSSARVRIFSGPFFANSTRVVLGYIIPT